MGDVWEPDGTTFTISPPSLINPIYACSESVAVQGLSGAVVRVYDGTGLQGSATVGGSGRAYVNVAPLVAGSPLYATQSANGQTSDPSLTEFVQGYNASDAPTLKIEHDVYECGERISPDGVIPGAIVFIEEDQTGQIGSAATNASPSRQGWWPVPHDPMPPQKLVRAHQVICPDTHEQLVSLPSDWQEVLPQPSPLPTVDPVQFHAGATSIRVNDALTGAHVTAVQASANWAERWATRASITLYGSSALQENQDVGVTQGLCTKGPEIIVSPLPASSLEQLPPPQILEPLCPGTTSVRVRAPLDGARLHVRLNGTLIGQADGSTTFSKIEFYGAQELSANDTIVVEQIYPGVTANVYGPSASATVGPGDDLYLLDAETFIDQNTGAPVDGFLRETSRGPRFALHCCASCTRDREQGQCYDPTTFEPRTATVRLAEDGIPFDEIELIELSPGYFEGRWDWFMPTGQSSSWPPDPGAEYTAAISDSPCSTQHSTSIEVLIGEIDPNDPTPPEDLTLTVTVPGGPSASIGLGDPLQDIDSPPGTTLDIDLTGFDPQGLSEVALESLPQGIIASPTSKQSDPNIVPIPPHLTLETTVEAPLPYEAIRITANASNFNPPSGSVNLSEIRVHGEHPTPVLSNLSHSQMYSDMSLTISGSHLRYDTLSTSVHFSLDPHDDGPPVNDSISVSSTGSSNEIVLSQLPTSLEGRRGLLSVWVETSHGATTEVGNTLNVELFDREQGPFEVFEVSDFSDSSSNCHTSGGDTGKITSITVTNDNGSFDHIAIFDSDGRSGTEHGPFNIDTHGYGGYVVSDNCRAAAIFSYNDGSSGPMLYNLQLIYFPPLSDSPITYNADTVTLHREYNNNGTMVYELVLRAFRFFFSPDATLAAIGNPNALITSGGTNIQVTGRVFDFLAATAEWSGQGACNTSDFCEPKVELDGSEVELWYVLTTSPPDNMTLVSEALPFP